jgi:hypothetical protein
LKRETLIGSKLTAIQELDWLDQVGFARIHPEIIEAYGECLTHREKFCWIAFSVIAITRERVLADAGSGGCARQEWLAST